ncbi:MAG TPA: hypothetical protein VIG99_06035 [Myxococcaceae bacterium]|jgi:hypothetical protein
MAGDNVSEAIEASDPRSVEAAELEVISSQASYDAFAAAARAIPADAVQECCADIVLAYENATRGVENVLGSALVVVNKLPGVNVEELSALPRIAQGLAFAALQVHKEVRAAPFGTLFERAQQLRRKLGKAADALAESSLLPVADVEDVRLHAHLDAVDECEALTALFQRHFKQIDGRSPVNATDLKEVEHVVQKLRAALGQPGEAKAEGGPALVQATEMRDRFWALLNVRHDLLWRCGAWLYGRAVDERVPPLPVRHTGLRHPRASVAEREAPRALARQRALSAAGSPARAASSTGAAARSLANQMGELWRKTKFLIRIGGETPPQG